MREGVRFTVGPMSYTTSNTSLRGTPVPPTRSATGFDWQWANKTRISPTGVSAEAPDIIGTTPENVATPEGRTQANLNAWYQQIWDSGFKVGRVEIGYHPGDRPNPAIPQVLAAHCEWDVTLSSNADTNSEGSTLNDDVTLDAVPVWDLAEGETAPWLTVDGEKAQVTVHGIPPLKIHEGFKWKDTSHFLERAHLQAHCVRGNDKPSNIVLLCPLCHRAMPHFTSREEALCWVSERYSYRVRTASTALHDVSWQLYTDTHPCCDRDELRQQYKLFLISIMIQAQATLNAESYLLDQ